MNQNSSDMTLINLIKSSRSIGIQRSKNHQNRMQISSDRVGLNSGRWIALDRGNLAANRASGVLITAGSVLDRRIIAWIERCRPMVIRVMFVSE